MIQKLYNPSILLPSVGAGNALQCVPADLSGDLNRFEEEVDALMTEMEGLDASVRQVRESFDELAQGVCQLGSASAGLFGSENSNKAKGLIGVLSLAIKGVGYITERRKKRRMRDKYYARRQEILYQKQLVAEEKLPHVRQASAAYQSVSGRIKVLYRREAAKVVDLGSPDLEAAIAMMRAAMALHLKSRYLVEVMGYCMAEMEAWQRGQHDAADCSIPTVDEILTDEISGWAQTLCAGMPWDIYLHAAMDMPSGRLPLPIALLLSSPALLRCYVGINIGGAESCPFGLLQLDRKQPCGTVRNPLVLNNPYYLHCSDLASRDCPPRRPARFSLGDLLVWLVIPAALFGLLLLIFHWESSHGWRIFFMLPALCWAAIAIDYLRNNEFNLMPCHRRVQRYNAAFTAYRQAVMEQEDCQEFHVFY